MLQRLYETFSMLNFRPIAISDLQQSVAHLFSLIRPTGVIKVYIRPTICDHPTYKRSKSDLYKSVKSTYKKWTSELQKVYIRPTKSVHPTYNLWPSDLQKELYIRPSKRVHPTYKKFTSDLQKVYIRPTKIVYPTYKKCYSDLQMCKFVL